MRPRASAVAPDTGSGRIAHLDGLRGLALAMVLAHHFVTPLLDRTPESPGAYLAAALSFGFVGVDLFFVLSGYLVGGIILDHGSSPNFIRVFYLRRAFRILPLSLLCVAIVLLAQKTGWYGDSLDGGAPWPAWVYGSSLVNVWMAAHGDWGFRPLSPLWSLAIEEQFYLVAPVFLRVFPFGLMPRILFAILGFAVFFRLGLLLGGVNAFAVAMLPLSRMDSLCAGFLVAWVVRSRPARSWVAAHPGWLTASFGLSAMICIGLMKTRAVNGGPSMAAGGYTAVAAFFACGLLLLETRPRSPLHRLLAVGPLTWLGRRSYFIYLFQGLAIGSVIGLVCYSRPMIVHARDGIELLFGLAGLTGLAALSWRWLESPLIAFGRRWSYGRAPLHPCD